MGTNSELKRLTIHTGNSIEVTASIQGNGDLLVSEHDMTPAASQVFGTEDIESFLTVPAAHKDRLLLILLRECYGKYSGSINGLMELMHAEHVPHSIHRV